MADVRTLEIGPNLRTVLIAVLAALPVLVGQIWSVTAARDAARVSEQNGKRIGGVEKNVIDGRNDHRRSVGLPPVVVPETVTE